MRTLPATLARGLAAGLVAGLLLVALQALARLILGVSPPAELVGDRIAPLLTIDQFFGLFGVFGGYNGLKMAGIAGGTSGQLAVCVLIAVVFALVVRHSARRGLRLLALLTAVLFVAAVAVLWPILSTSYTGFAPATARLLTLAVMAVTFGSFGVAVAVVVGLLGGIPGDGEAADAESREGAPAGVGRRALLIGGGVGVVGIGLAAAAGGMGAELYRRATFSYDGRRVFGPTISPITPNEDFYTVTKNVIDPRVPAERWSFAVDGAVQNARTWDLPALRAMPQVTQETTLCCISNGVGDGLESNAMWTGVPLAELITAAGPSATTVEVLLTAVDGYTDTFSIEKAMDPTTLLAFGMNGVDLPQRHGYPARMIVPGMFGEKNLKWVTRVELVTEETKGFYETQGWGPTFVVPTRSRFTGQMSGAEVPRGRPVVLSGTAFGGDRGVSRVEVSVDGGRTWDEATLTYPGTRLSWSLWSYDWRPATPGPAALAVRATDGTGAVQTAEERSTVPQGATGYHQITVTVL